MIGKLRETGIRRVAIVLLMIGVAVAIALTSDRAGRMPESDWYAASRQRIVQADLMYRMGMYMDHVMPHEQLPAVGGARQLKERALAEYEREALLGRPNPVALHRLGVIYGDRGYLEQARQSLIRAATLDEPRAGLYFSLAAIYSPGDTIAPVGPQGVQRLRQQEEWLAGLALATYYERLGDPTTAALTREWAAVRTHAFGKRLLLLLSVYGGLGLIGLVILTFALIRWFFFVRTEAPPTRPPLVVSWESFEAVEVVALLYFATAVAGVLGGLILGRVSDAPELARVLVVAGQYLLVTGGILYLVWGRVAGWNHRKLSILGLRLHRPVWLAANGVGGYAVLVVMLALMTFVLPGGNPLGSAQAGERVLSAVHSLPARLVLFFVVCIVAPIVEEIIFRGFVYAGLRRRLGFGSAVAMSALLFALVHNSLAALVPITLIGVVLAVLYERNRSIVPSIICHALNNTLVFFLVWLTA